MKLIPLVALMLLFASGTVRAQQSPHGDIGLSCETCHSTDGWKMRPGAAFDHASTGFALEGSHRTVECKACHAGLMFSNGRLACNSCHMDPHQGELGPQCQRCHTNNSWTISNIRQLHQQTRFPLVGIHAAVTCELCHTGASVHKYAGTPVRCIGCHRPDFIATRNPNHTAAGFSVDCEKCHSTTSPQWSSGFDHALTRFPLTGAHRTVICSSCHKNNQFTALPVDCYSCHWGDFTAVPSPNHQTGGFSHDCLTCHTNTSWKPSIFDHSTTHFPLSGAHRAVECQSCHTSGNYSLTYSGCYSCHSGDFSSARNPVHTGFDHYCLTCHAQSAWSPASFDHSTTHFPLSGAHTAVACNNCHTNGNFALSFTDCYQCHSADFQRPANPNHVTAALPHDCSTCHNTTVWSPSTFDHSTTHFPLAGAHRGVACQSCHASGNYTLQFVDCYTCHSGDFTNARNPVHTGFDHNCLTCHTQSAWSPASFDHSTTHFPLTGAHTAVACNTCHTNGNFALAFTDCYQCHSADYQIPTNPNHVTAALPHDCSSCHGSTAWKPASFDHSTTAFALTGAHTTIACAACHSNGNYSLRFNECYQCHSADFAKPTDPNHVSANFGHDCRPCHSTTAWLPSTFNHDSQYFKINSGHHRGQWSSCSTCHTNNSNYAEFTCLSCHEHNQSSTDSHHTRVNGYQYLSSECYRCHRNV